MANWSEWAPTPLMFLVAGGSIYSGVSMYRWAKRAAQLGDASVLWPKTKGRITAGSVEHVSTGTTDDPGHYEPSVAYVYTVEGAAYTGSTIAFRDLRTWKKTAAAIVAKYPVGSEVEVSYDPAAPQSSVLEPGATGVRRSFVGAVVLILLGIFIAIIGVLIPLFHLH